LQKSFFVSSSSLPSGWHLTDHSMYQDQEIDMVETLFIWMSLRCHTIPTSADLCSRS
jgi:uncharacterized protein YbdZ (MbtH family)